MHGFRGGLIRIALTLAFGLASFYPQFGIVWQLWTVFPNHPAVAVFLYAIWAVVLLLLVPLSVVHFRRASSLILIAVMAYGCYLAYSLGIANPFTPNFWMIWGVAGLFLLFAWLLVATPVWRFFHGVMAVQQTTTVDVDEHHA